MISMSCKLEPAIWSHDTGQQIPYFDRCQLIITWMSDIKKVPVNQGCMSLSIYYWSMATMLRDSTAVAVVVVVRTRPRAIPLAMVHMRKSIHGFPSVPLYGYGAPLGGRRSSAMIVLLLKFSKMQSFPSFKRVTVFHRWLNFLK